MGGIEALSPTELDDLRDVVDELRESGDDRFCRRRHRAAIETLEAHGLRPIKMNDDSDLPWVVYLTDGSAVQARFESPEWAMSLLLHPSLGDWTRPNSSASTSEVSDPAGAAPLALAAASGVVRPPGEVYCLTCGEPVEPRCRRCREEERDGSLDRH